MSNAAGALRARGADDGPVGRVGNALLTICAGFLSASGASLAEKLVFVGTAVTYVLW